MVNQTARSGAMIDVTQGGTSKLSSNLTTTQKATQAFDSVLSVVAGGLSAAAPLIPGGAIVSAALSSVAGAVDSAATSDTSGGGIGGGMGDIGGGGGSGGGSGLSGALSGLTGAGGGIGGISSGGSPMAGMQQMQAQMFQQNLSMVALQQRMGQDSEKISTLSKIIESQHDADMSAVNNIH